MGFRVPCKGLDVAPDGMVSWASKKKALPTARHGRGVLCAAEALQGPHAVGSELALLWGVASSVYPPGNTRVEAAHRHNFHAPLAPGAHVETGSQTRGAWVRHKSRGYRVRHATTFFVLPRLPLVGPALGMQPSLFARFESFDHDDLSSSFALVKPCQPDAFRTGIDAAKSID